MDARDHALSVADIWNAPPVVWQYLQGDDTLKIPARCLANRYARTAVWARDGVGPWFAARATVWAASDDPDATRAAALTARLALTSTDRKECHD